MNRNRNLARKYAATSAVKKQIKNTLVPPTEDKKEDKKN